MSVENGFPLLAENRGDMSFLFRRFSMLIVIKISGVDSKERTNSNESILINAHRRTELIAYYLAKNKSKQDQFLGAELQTKIRQYFRKTVECVFKKQSIQDILCPSSRIHTILGLEDHTLTCTWGILSRVSFRKRTF